jgi:hypothetical protein
LVLASGAGGQQGAHEVGLEALEQRRRAGGRDVERPA